MNPPQILDDPEEIREKVPLPAADAPAIRRAEGDAEQRRQQAFDAVPHWNGRPLQPFSVSRETLFLQLRHSAGAPGIYSAMIDGEAWFADAVRILWLCLHVPDDWGQLRSQPLELQRAIDDWADKHIPRGSKADVIVLTLRIWNESQINAHEPVPGDAAEGRQESGN